MSVTTQRKNQIVNFLENRENRFGILKTLYEQGWRLDLLHNHSRWQAPQTSSVRPRRKASILSYEFAIDDTLETVEVIAIIKPDLLNSDITQLIETIDEVTLSYDEKRLQDGSLVKIIISHSPTETYEDTWREEGIRIIQIEPLTEPVHNHMEEFEKQASLLTYAMRGVP